VGIEVKWPLGRSEGRRTGNTRQCTASLSRRSRPSHTSKARRRKLLELLRESTASADELVRRAGLDAGEVARALVELELAGLAAAADGVYRAVGV